MIAARIGCSGWKYKHRAVPSTPPIRPALQPLDRYRAHQHVVLKLLFELPHAGPRCNEPTVM